MTRPIDLTEIRRRTFRDTAMDGLVELMLGIWFFYISGALYKNGKGFSFVLLPFAFYLIYLGLKYLKNRYVYPRLGYMKLPAGNQTNPNMKLLPYSLIAGLVVLVGILFITGDYRYPMRWYFWIPVFISIFLSGVFIYQALGSGLIRYYFYVIVNILSVILSMLLPFEGKLEVISNYLLILSGFFIIAGIFIFILFIWKNPIQTVEIEANNEKK